MNPPGETRSTFITTAILSSAKLFKNALSPNYPGLDLNLWLQWGLLMNSELKPAAMTIVV